MELSKNIYFHNFETSEADGPRRFHCVSAVQLISCPAARLREVSPNGLPLPYISKQVDLINSLHQSDKQVSYAIRYISYPSAFSYAAGRVDCCIFCKATSQTSEDALALAQHSVEQLMVQLCGTIPDYLWQVVSEGPVFESFWQPLDWKKSHQIEIRRREESIYLDSIQPYRPLGFTRAEGNHQEMKGCPVYLTHAFLPHPGQLERLLRVMLLGQTPSVLTLTLTPTLLNQEEHQALLDEISHSEGFQFDPSPGIQRIQEQRAQMISHELMGQSLSLQDAPFYVTVSLSSGQAIPPSLAETVGVAVSAPIGEGPNPQYSEPAFIQMGGYDVVRPQTNLEKELARENAACLDQKPWGRTLAPQSLKRLRFLMAGLEAANAFRFPEDNDKGLAGMKVHTQRVRPLPIELAAMKPKEMEGGLLLGKNHYLGSPQEVILPAKDRLTHMYTVGQTGTGKSTLLKSMILSDIHSGNGCALIDPHGDLFEEILGQIPPERIEDVVIFDPSDLEFPVGMNLLETNDPNERTFVVREVQAIMRRLMEDQYGAYTAQQITGPIFYQHMQMNLLLATSNPDEPGTLLDFYQIYQSSGYWKRWIPLRMNDPQLSKWISGNLSKNTYTDPGRGGDASLGNYLSSKFTDFIFDPRLLYIFAQPRSTINLFEIMNTRKILLVNLAKGLLGEANARFLGLVIMAKLQSEAMKRAKLPAAERVPFYLYVDEFQSLATENFTVLLSEARKFGVGLVLANQFISQIKDERIIQSVFGNVGTFLCFRLGREDAQLIEPQFLPYYDRTDLANLPNWQIAVRTTVNGKGIPPFSLQTMLPPQKPDARMAKLVRAASRKRYGTPRAKVDEIIKNSLDSGETEA